MSTLAVFVVGMPIALLLAGRVRGPEEIASPVDWRLIVSCRVQHLVLLEAAGGAVVGTVRFLTLQLRLAAVALLAIFVVMVIVRTIRSIAGLGLPGKDEEMRR